MRILPFPDVCLHLKQTCFENIVTKEEIAHDEQFLLKFATIFSMLSHWSLVIHSKLCAADCLHVGKG